MAKVVLTGCSAENSGSDGFYFGPGVDAEVNSSLARGNGRNGFTFDGATGSANNSVADGNAGHGFYVSDEDRAEIEAAIAAKPVAERASWLSRANDVFTGVAAGITVEMFKAALGLK